MKAVLKIVAKRGENPSAVADSYGQPWRDSVAACNADGTGIVFIECDAADVEHWIDEIGSDDRVESVVRHR